MSIIPLQTLRINNFTTTIRKCINLRTTRKLIECSLKVVSLKEIIALIFFEILLFEGRLVFSPANKVQGAKG